MALTRIKFKEWVFEVDKELTEKAYRNVSESGAERCGCNDCKNYLAFRDMVFPKDILELFRNLGINYKKEVEVFSYETLPNGLHHISGWFHFKGNLVAGKDYKVTLPSGGNTVGLASINDDFSIGFGEGNDLTFFEEKSGLIQVEFDTNIPWIIDKSLEVF